MILTRVVLSFPCFIFLLFTCGKSDTRGYRSCYTRLPNIPPQRPLSPLLAPSSAPIISIQRVEKLQKNQRDTNALHAFTSSLILLSLHDKTILLTICHDFSPVALLTLPRAHLTNAVNFPNSPPCLPTHGYPRVRKVTPPGFPGALPHQTQDPPYTPPMASTPLGLPPLNHSTLVGSPLHAPFVSSAFRMPPNLVGIRSQNNRASPILSVPASGPGRRLLG